MNNFYSEKIMTQKGEQIFFLLNLIEINDFDGKEFI
jgi:hypothetical protein